METSEKEKALQLTAQARTIIERFEKLEKDVENILKEAEQEFKKLFQTMGK